MYGSDTCLQDICADKFSDGHGRGGVVGRCEVSEDRSNNTGDDATASGISHAKSMGAEKHEWLENFMGRKHKVTNRV